MLVYTQIECNKKYHIDSYDDKFEVTKLNSYANFNTVVVSLKFSVNKLMMYAE